MTYESEAARIQRRDSLQSSQPTEWVTKVLVHRRIATNRVVTIGATIETITMACCWVEGSVSMAILDGRNVREKLSQKAKGKHKRY